MKFKLLLFLLLPLFCQGQGSFLKIISPVTAINDTGKSNLTITGITIAGGTSRCISLYSCNNIHITLCRFINSTAEGIYLYNCTGITIDYCFFCDVLTGVNAVNCPLGAIAVNNSQFRDIAGPHANLVQFNNVTGANNSISNNIADDHQYQSFMEDNISLYESAGTSGSPILVNSNQIRGGGPSTTGSGILIGDVTGSYETASNNILVNTGNVGIGVASGSNEVVIGNQIYGAQLPWSNVGVYFLNLYSGCSVITSSNNLVNWTNSGGLSNGTYTDGSCGSIGGSGNNYSDGSITSAILGAAILTYN